MPIDLLQIKRNLEKLGQDRCNDNGYHEPDTNSFIIDDESSAYLEAIDDAINVIDKALKKNT